MRLAICPGTFDPVTNGHLDIIQRGLRIFDGVIVAVAPSQKKTPLFTLEERLWFIRESVKDFGNISVEPFSGLLVDYVKAKGGLAIIKGLRAISDFEYELQMALMNRKLDMYVETVFMMPSEEFSFLTSTMVKEVASFGGSVKGLVPEIVEQALKEKIGPMEKIEVSWQGKRC
jgi:pantetheine-phosphate adenylyltransferase